MSKPFELPDRIVQSFGVLTAMPELFDAEQGEAERIATAVAIVTLTQRDDGHVELHVSRLSNQREREFALSHLVDDALVANAPALITPAERRALAVSAMRDGNFVEPRLAAMIAGDHAVDVSVLAPGTEPVRERRLARTLRLPWAEAPAAGTLRASSASLRDVLLTEAALGRAVTRLILWSHLRAVQKAEPALFYEPMRAVQAWLAGCEHIAPNLHGWASRSRILRAVSLWEPYAQDLESRMGRGERIWPVFEDGLFHS